MRSRIIQLATVIGALTAAQQSYSANSGPVIIDTDAGIDDIMAIAYLLATPGLKIDAISTVNGLLNPQVGAARIQALLDKTHRDIPAVVGESQPMDGAALFPEPWRQFADDVTAKVLGHHRPKNQRARAIPFLRDRLQNIPGKAVLLCLGPLTNVGKLLKESPEMADRISKIVLMGGALRVKGNLRDGDAFKTTNEVAEWNIFIDPTAASIVFSSGVPIVMIPLDATNSVPIRPDLVARIRQRESTFARIVSDLLLSAKPLIETGAYYAWDPLAAVALVHPEVIQTERVCVDVVKSGDRAGQTRLRQTGCKIDVAIRADAHEFERIFVNAL